MIKRTGVLFVPPTCNISNICTFKTLCSNDPAIGSFVLYGSLLERDTYPTAVRDQINTWINLKRYNEQMSPLLSLESSAHLCMFSIDNLVERVFVDTNDGNVIPNIDIEIDNMLYQNRFDSTLFNTTRV